MESQQAFTESAQQCFVESEQVFTESLQALAPQHSSTAAFSVWLLAALLPQEAKETATNATNKNTNFFIFFVFLICKTIVFSKNGAKLYVFLISCIQIGTFFIIFVMSDVILYK